MDFSELLSEKTRVRDELKNTFHLPKRPKTLVAIYFSDTNMTHALLEWLAALPVNFIVVSSTKFDEIPKNAGQVASLEDLSLLWIDALLCDCKDIRLEHYMKDGIIPIVNEKNYLWKILTEFSAARGEGNAYLYEDNSYWSAYYALVRYLENLTFPYDNRNLIKNVVWM